MIDQLLDQNKIDDWVARTGQPYITLSWAQSLDGSLTLKQGESSPVSGGESMQITHQLRSRHDGILVGIGTVLADNPSLTARSGEKQMKHQPRPIVVDSHLRTPANSRLFNHPLRPIIGTALPIQEPQIELNADIIRLPATDAGDVDLNALLSRLRLMKIRSVMVEGGGRIITSFLNAKLANRAIITIAPVLAGGYGAVQTLNHAEWLQLPRLINMQTQPCGSDLIVSGCFERP